MELILYGIPNCDSIKKTRAWLQEKRIEYHFHNYKKEGIPTAKLNQFVTHLGIDQVLNKKGTTWRKLVAEGIKTTLSTSAAIKLMKENPSLIKRPILEMDGKYFVGFNEDSYQKLFTKK